MLLFAFIGLIALLSGGVFGQSSEKQPKFEIADIHTSPHTMQPFMQGGILAADRYSLRQANMVDLIRTAYGVEPENVLGGPSWLELDRFDVIAKTPPGTPPETLKPMLRPFWQTASKWWSTRIPSPSMRSCLRWAKASRN